MDGTKSLPTTPPEAQERPGAVPLEAVRRAFTDPGGAKRAPPDWLLADPAYLIRLARMSPRAFFYGRDRKKLAGAIRTIRAVMPALIADAEREARAAGAEGRASSVERFPEFGRTLLAATLPFQDKRVNPRGDWHGWAGMLSMEAGLIFSRMGEPPPGFASATGTGIAIVKRLLVLAGFDDVDEEALVTALRRKGGWTVKQNPRLTGCHAPPHR